jgi:hypothetical protein
MRPPPTTIDGTSAAAIDASQLLRWPLAVPAALATPTTHAAAGDAWESIVARESIVAIEVRAMVDYRGDRREARRKFPNNTGMVDRWIDR